MSRLRQYLPKSKWGKGFLAAILAVPLVVGGVEGTRALGWKLMKTYEWRFTEEGFVMVKAVAKIYEVVGASSAAGNLLTEITWFKWRSEPPATNVPRIRKAIVLCEKGEDARCVFRAKKVLLDQLIWWEKLDEAYALLAELLEEQRALGNDRRVAWLLTDRGITRSDHGDYDGGEDDLILAFSMFQDMEDTKGQLETTLRLAKAASEQKNYQMAMQRYSVAKEIDLEQNGGEGADIIQGIIEKHVPAEFRQEEKAAQ